jgi:hypothetical protein
MILDIREVDIEFNSYNILYNQIYENIDTIFEEYTVFLDPKNNSLTHKFLIEGYQRKDAFTLSFMSTLLLNLQLKYSFDQ